MADVSTISFQGVATERRRLSEQIMAATAAVTKDIPDGKKNIAIMAVDVRRGEPSAVFLFGRKLNEHWTLAFSYTGSKADGHAVAVSSVVAW